MFCSSSTSEQAEESESDIETTAGEGRLKILDLPGTGLDSVNDDFEVPYSRKDEPRNSQPSESGSLYDTNNEPPSSLDKSDVEELGVPIDDGEGIVCNVQLSQEMEEENTQIEKLAENWINTYRTSHFEGLRAMLELILNSTGRLLPITKQEALDLDKLNVDTFNTWMRKPNVSPLVLNDVYLKNLVEFLKLTLVQDVCLNDILIMKRIYNLLQVFVSSTWVSARYSALMIGSTIVIQYIKYWSAINTQLHDALAADNETDLKKEMEVVEDMFADFIKFVTLCMRDINLVTRKIAVRIFSSWCQQKEQLVLSDIYLRYVFFALFDENRTVLYFAMKTCNSLYGCANVIRNLLFVEKTLPIVIRRVQDRSNLISTAALDTLLELQRHSPLLLQGENLQPVFLLLFGSRGSQAAQAAAFLNNKLEHFSSNNNMYYIFNAVIFIQESLGEIGEVTDPDIDPKSVVSVFVDRFMPLSHQRMTDWVAWRRLLLEDCSDNEKHQELTCLLLVNIMNHLSICAGDRLFVDTDFPPVPTVNNCKVVSATKKSKPKIFYEENQCSKYLLKMTLSLGSVLLRLWEKFENNKICLISLVTIPQYFSGYIDTLDIKGICCTLIFLRNKMVDSASLEAIHRSMACLLHLMLASQHWKRSITNFERALFSSVPDNFTRALEKLNKLPLPASDVMNCLKDIKLAFFLSKFFDVTKTSLVENAINALKLGKVKKIAKIICPAAQMCLYILQWQLKDIVEGDIDRNEMLARLYKIKTQSHTLVILLEDLISSEYSFVRDTAYAVLCRLYALLCPHNAYANPYPLIHLTPPSLRLMEWLNFSMVCQVPKSNIPEDENEYVKACNALQLFCFLLCNEVLALEYISSILSFFKFHAHSRNYNSILESIFRVLLQRRPIEFPHVIIESLECMASITEENMVEIVKGICSVFLSKLKPPKLAQKTALEIVGHGLSLIRRHNHILFLMLAPFVKLLDKRDAQEILKNVRDTFHVYLEKREVKAFLDAFGRSPVSGQGTDTQ